MAGLTGAEIMAAREQRGMTREGLATQVGVYATPISRWERGQNAPHGATLARLRACLGLSGPTPPSTPFDTLLDRLRSYYQASGGPGTRMWDGLVARIDDYLTNGPDRHVRRLSLGERSQGPCKPSTRTLATLHGGK